MQAKSQKIYAIYSTTLTRKSYTETSPSIVHIFCKKIRKYNRVLATTAKNFVICTAVQMTFEQYEYLEIYLTFYQLAWLSARHWERFFLSLTCRERFMTPSANKNRWISIVARALRPADDLACFRSAHWGNIPTIVFIVMRGLKVRPDWTFMVPLDRPWKRHQPL